jgi:hypothetical protein
MAFLFVSSFPVRLEASFSSSPKFFDCITDPPFRNAGRSVKWLKKIEISDKESQHHLHFWVRSPLSALFLEKTS